MFGRKKRSVRTKIPDLAVAPTVAPAPTPPPSMDALRHLQEALRESAAAAAQDPGGPISLHDAVERLQSLQDQRATVDRWHREVTATLDGMIAALKALLAQHWPAELQEWIRLNTLAAEMSALAERERLPLDRETALRFLMDAWHSRYQQQFQRALLTPKPVEGGDGGSP